MPVETPIYDRLLLNQYEFEPTLRCEGEGHPKGLSYHVPDQLGEYLICSPCCGPIVLVCRSRKEYLSGPTCAEIRCVKCKQIHPSTQYRFEPLP